MSSSTDVVGYAYEADVHCLSCTEKKFPGSVTQELEPTDFEGNTVSPVFNTEDATEECECAQYDGRCKCDGCGDEHDCSKCNGTGRVMRCCGDCGEELDANMVVEGDGPGASYTRNAGTCVGGEGE